MVHWVTAAFVPLGKDEKRESQSTQCTGQRASRKRTQVKSIEYRNLTKKLKKRVNFLRNEKLAKEAEEIDTFTAQRDIANLFKSMKSGTDTFGNIKRNNKMQILG